MAMTVDNIYIKENHDWPKKLKYGYVKGEKHNLINRLNNSREEHSELSKFTNIFKFEKTSAYKLEHYSEIDKIISLIGSNLERISKLENIYGVKLPLFNELNKYLVKSKTKISNEFINIEGVFLLLRVLREEFPLLGLRLVNEYLPEEIEVINNTIKKTDNEQVRKKYKSFLKLAQAPRKSKPTYSKQLVKDEYKWFDKEYQRTIIEYATGQLGALHRFYLELATGGGKSYIIYKIISKLKPDMIIIFSPRKNINKQNSSSKYMSILDNEYLIYDCSDNIKFETFKLECERQDKKMIIIGCSQSQSADNKHKIYDIINNNDTSNVLIWFDEAHHTIEKWVNMSDNKYTKFLLENNNIINNRIFTSASPDKIHISEYPHIFGELYSPIKVKELILLKWLSPIVPHIFSLNKNDVDICNYNLDHFNKFGCKFGFSFHNNCENAINLFIQHYNKYIQGNTIIKPFLLIGKDYYKNPKLNNIELDYDYKLIKSYEKIENSMGYVVQQYSIGYDFNKIDYIIFSDTKLSYSDIIQCIGRGIRPDGLGPNGQNLYKKLSIMLPVYIESEIDTNFNRIEGVLRYLVHDIDYPFEAINMNFSLGGNKKFKGKQYNGKDIMRAILLDLLKGGKYSTWKPKDFITLMKNNNIHDREKGYNKFIKDRPELNLPEDPYRCFPEFTWEQTFSESPYYSKEECKQKIAEIKEDEDLDFDEVDEPEVYLNSIDPKIPPQCLFRFYGGFNNNEYY